MEEDRAIGITWQKKPPWFLFIKLFFPAGNTAGW